MAEIVHRVRVRATPADVLRAVREEALRVAFWPIDSKLSMQAVAVGDAPKVAWCCTEGPAEWVGTDISFDVAPEGAETVVRFSHGNWRESTDYMAQCATSWARVLLGLKSHIEIPEPDDVLI
jgi:hypothetical protein